MKINERERCGRCQKWINIYNGSLDPRDENDGSKIVCKKCCEILVKEMQKV